MKEKKKDHKVNQEEVLEAEMDQEVMEEVSDEAGLGEEPSLEEAETKEESNDTSTDETTDEVAALSLALVKAEALANENIDKYQRTMAEFDNFRKRTMKEKAQMFENGAKEVLEKLLPVVDNFERAMEHMSQEDKELPVAQGISLIYKQMMSVLADLGVEEIPAHLQEFNPDLHHAVSHEENEEYDENLVVEVFQKGYKYKDSVIRYSMVKVAN
ncbi:MAG: nucleotide exchange factor GrpE [Vallitaleaceae bacterium]|nr:nucleotide exchange factor GrpE [Vallitaleaceae bacterium]